MPKIARFVNGTDIQRLFAESGTSIGYRTALRIKTSLINMHPDVILPKDNVIPITWVFEVYGSEMFKNGRS
ncbi:MAG: hypothetical protein RR585_05400 [Coprobacillus sp.]